jgi:hypothetical protein
MRAGDLFRLCQNFGLTVAKKKSSCVKTLTLELERDGFSCTRPKKGELDTFSAIFFLIPNLNL